MMNQARKEIVRPGAASAPRRRIRSRGLATQARIQVVFDKFRVTRPCFKNQPPMARLKRRDS